MHQTENPHPVLFEVGGLADLGYLVNEPQGPTLFCLPSSEFQVPPLWKDAGGWIQSHGVENDGLGLNERRVRGPMGAMPVGSCTQWKAHPTQPPEGWDVRHRLP